MADAIDNAAEAAAREIGEGVWCDTFDEANAAWLKDIIARHMREAVGWISVDERLPHHGQDVLVLFGGRTFCVCSFWVGDGCGSTKPVWLNAMHHPDGTPTHWMPLPDLPATPEEQP